MANTSATEDIHSTYTDAHIPREEPHGNYLAILSLAALGVVYGDIGTSPLYALRECFHGPHAIAVTPENVLGVLSLIFWSLIIVISIKYLIFVVRADNEGEGGILSLAALATPIKPSGRTEKMVLIALGIFGAALLYGDGVLTPAISVLERDGRHQRGNARFDFVYCSVDNRGFDRIVFSAKSRNSGHRKTFRTCDIGLVCGFGDSRHYENRRVSACFDSSQSVTGDSVFHP